jgi:hypothetical protein
VLTGAIVLVAGCVGHDCTEMGCLAGVAVQVSNTFAVELLPVEVTTCADDVCTSEVITPAMAAPDQPTFGVEGSVMLGEKQERDVAVTIEVRSISTDRILVSASGSGRLNRSQPNGAGCGPVCYGTAFIYPGSGTRLEEKT